MLLETADGEEDAEGKADDDESKDETDFQVEQSAVQFCTISHVWTTETSFWILSTAGALVVVTV